MKRSFSGGIALTALIPNRRIALAVLPGTPNSGHTPRLVVDVAHRW